MKKIILSVLVFLLASSISYAQIRVWQGGTGLVDVPEKAIVIGTDNDFELDYTYNPEVETITATSTTATSTLPWLETARHKITDFLEITGTLIGGAAGSNTQIQFNNGGNFGGANLIYLENWEGFMDGFGLSGLPGALGVFDNLDGTLAMQFWTDENFVNGLEIGDSNFGIYGSAERHIVSTQNHKYRFKGQSGGEGILDFSEISGGPRNYKLPPLSGTFALLEETQTFTGAKTFTATTTFSDIVPINDKGSSIGTISGQTPKRFKVLHTYDPHNFSDFFTLNEAGNFGFSTAVVIGNTISILPNEANGLLSRGRNSSGNVQDIGSSVWTASRNPVFYSRQRFNSISDVQRIWGFRTSGTDISNTQGCFFGQLTGETDIRAICRDGSGTASSTTGVAVADLTMQDFKIELATSTPVSRFYINNTLTNTITTNIPAGFFSWIYRTETSGAGTKTFEIDFIGITQNRDE